jgi:hypothetical protein
MKPEIKAVGNYVEGSDGGIKIEGWEIDNRNASESFTPDDLRQIAIASNTFVKVDGIVKGTDSRGIRWYGEDPFGS